MTKNQIKFSEQQLEALKNYHDMLEKAYIRPDIVHVSSAAKKVLGEIYLSFSPNDCIKGCGNAWVKRLANWYFKYLKNEQRTI